VVFAIDPQNPDPGRVTVRRLNRVEYRNTIRDLMGVDFDTEKEFPPDDAGYGFDNIGDVLTLPPMLLEKYLTAARAVVTKAVPTVPGVPAEKFIAGRTFSGEIGAFSRTNRNPMATNALTLSYYEPASVSNTFKAQHAGRYELLLDFAANERFVDNQFDYNKCRLVFKADGRELHSKEYNRNAVASRSSQRRRNRVAVDDFSMPASQGSSVRAGLANLATLGFAPESRWDSFSAHIHPKQPTQTRQ
jgi:hypothetical protein